MDITKKISIKIPKLHSEHFFYFFLILFWGQDIVFTYAKAFLLRIPIIKLVANYFFPFCMTVCILLSIEYLVKKISWKDIIFIIVFLAIYIVQMIFYQKNGEYLGAVSETLFLYVLPLYFVGLCIDVNKHLNTLYIMSIINVWMFVVYHILFEEAVTASQASYHSSLHQAYILLPQLLVIFGYMLQKMNYINVITAVVGFVFLIMCGNRGTVVLLLLYIFIYLMFLLEKRKRWGIYLAVGALSVYVIYSFNKLIVAMRLLFVRFGVSTRILDRLASGDFFDSSGRDNIAETLLQAIHENPIWGYGIASDRVITEGSYAHNLALELWTSFGIVVGSILLLAIINIIAYGWIKAQDVKNRFFLLVLFVSGFLKLFISSTYLAEGLFFMLLGFCVQQIRKRKTVTNNLRGDHV